MIEDGFEQFVEEAKKDKAAHRLHPLAEKRLISLLSQLYPSECTISEVAGVLGGRNDAMHFAFNGRRAAFEFFFSPSQVPEDLRLLERVRADVKMAILLDREIDNAKLANEYFHKKPDHFPYLWLSSLMLPSQEEVCLMHLREWLDEAILIGPLVQRLLNAFNRAPIHTFSSRYSDIIGQGVYGLYYFGDYGLYAPIARQNRATQDKPIYIGKAAVAGRRMGIRTEQYTALAKRMRKHSQSIGATSNLQIEDFQYRFILLGNINEEDESFIDMLETKLIKKYQPLWNTPFLEGFGNHDPGSGRYNQQCSRWDTLHPGRVWANKLLHNHKNRDIIHEEVSCFLSSTPNF